VHFSAKREKMFLSTRFVDDEDDVVEGDDVEAGERFMIGMFLSH
jgi:hypothetical protein